MTAAKKIREIFFGTYERKTITKNTMWLSAAEVITRLSKFALIIYATRILGPTGFGQFSFALSFVMIFAVFSDLGLSQIASRELSQGKSDRKEFANILWLKFALSLVVLIAVFISSAFTITDTIIEKSIFILSVFMITNSISDFYFAFFQAKQKMQYEAWAKIIQAILTTLLGFILLKQFKSSAGLSLGYTLAGIASLIYILTLYHLNKKKTTLKGKFSFKIWKTYLGMAWPLVFTSIFAMIYNDIDSVMMGYYGQITQVGLYNASYRIVWVVLIPGLLLYRSFYPAINKRYLESREKFKKTWLFYLRVNLLMIPFFLIPGILFARQIINLIFGQEYIGAVLSFQILMVVASLTLLSYPFNQVLIASNNQRKIFWSTLVGALINMILNISLIPKYSLNGAAIATLTAVALVFVLQVYFSIKIQKKV